MRTARPPTARTVADGAGIVAPDDETPTWRERKERREGLAPADLRVLRALAPRGPGPRTESSYVERDVLGFPTWPHEMVRNLSLIELLRRDDPLPLGDAPPAHRPARRPEYDAGDHPPRLVSLLVVRAPETRAAQPRTRRARWAEADAGLDVRRAREPRGRRRSSPSSPSSTRGAHAGRSSSRSGRRSGCSAWCSPR